MIDSEILKIDMIKELALLLMNDNPDQSMEQALHTVINSDTYQRLMNDATHLYYQSPRYVYSFLDNELKTGAVR